jgi:predicted RNase H-like HicB family nuclease
LEELTFIAERCADGGYTARAVGADIFTEGDDFEELRAMILDAARCHYEDEEFPRKISIHTALFTQES